MSLKERKEQKALKDLGKDFEWNDETLEEVTNGLEEDEDMEEMNKEQ